MFYFYMNAALHLWLKMEKTIKTYKKNLYDLDVKYWFALRAIHRQLYASELIEQQCNYMLVSSLNNNVIIC